MSIATKGLSVLGNLVIIGSLLACFGAGLVGVVYFSLSGNEIKVPDIVGKDFVQSEKELASLGLKIKRRADRPSNDKINTVLEQLPKPGETVKTGQMILVVVSKAAAPGEVTPPSLKVDVDKDDTEKIEEMISDKPKKSKSNSNTNKKKPDTTRDVISNSDTTSPDMADDEKKASDEKKTTADETKKTTGEEKEKVEPKTQRSPAGASPVKPQPTKRPGN